LNGFGILFAEESGESSTRFRKSASFIQEEDEDMTAETMDEILIANAIHKLEKYADQEQGKFVRSHTGWEKIQIKCSINYIGVKLYHEMPIIRSHWITFGKLLPV